MNYRLSTRPPRISTRQNIRPPFGAAQPRKPGILLRRSPERRPGLSTSPGTAGRRNIRAGFFLHLGCWHCVTDPRPHFSARPGASSHTAQNAHKWGGGRQTLTPSDSPRCRRLAVHADLAAQTLEDRASGSRVSPLRASSRSQNKQFDTPRTTRPRAALPGSIHRQVLETSTTGFRRHVLRTFINAAAAIDGAANSSSATATPTITSPDDCDTALHVACRGRLRAVPGRSGSKSASRTGAVPARTSASLIIQSRPPSPVRKLLVQTAAVQVPGEDEHRQGRTDGLKHPVGSTTDARIAGAGRTAGLRAAPDICIIVSGERFPKLRSASVSKKKKNRTVCGNTGPGH